MTTASVKERKEIFAELRQCIKGRGERFLIQSVSYTFLFNSSGVLLNLKFLQISLLELPEPAIRGLCKLFCLTPHRYRWACTGNMLHTEWLTQRIWILKWKHSSDVAKLKHVFVLQGCCIPPRAPLCYWPAGWDAAWNPGDQPPPLPAELWSHQQKWSAGVHLSALSYFLKDYLKGFQSYYLKYACHWDCALPFVCYICSKSSGSAAFLGLSWTCLLTSRVFSAPEKREGTLWKKMVSRGVYCTTSGLSLKVLKLSVVILGGGSEPSCCWGAWRGQDQSSEVDPEKFQSPLEASEYKTSQKCKQHLMLQ